MTEIGGDFVKTLHEMADQVIGGNAPWLADELHDFANRLAAEMRGECQWREARRRRAREICAPLLEVSCEDLRTAWLMLPADKRRRLRELMQHET